MNEEYYGCAEAEKKGCPFLHLYVHIRNQMVMTDSLRSHINRHVVRVENNIPDPVLDTPHGKSLLVKNHVCHGGAGRFCKKAYDYLVGLGVQVEPQMVPVSVESDETL